MASSLWVSIKSEEQPVTMVITMVMITMVMITTVMITLPWRWKSGFTSTHWIGARVPLFGYVLRKFPHLQPVILTCLLASTPTSLSPSLVKATTEGVVLDPSAFSITLGFLPSITATHELVVPRSIPITVPFTSELHGRTEERAITNTWTHTANVDSFPALHPHFYHEQ